MIDDEDFRAKVTREEMEELCSDLWDRVPGPMADALESSHLTWDLISKIILVGGGTRVPKVQEILLKVGVQLEHGLILFSLFYFALFLDFFVILLVTF